MGQPYFIFVLRNDLLNNRIVVNNMILNKKHLLRQTLDDKALGCLVGGAVGDALGYAIEFEQWPYICNTYGGKGITRYELASNGKALISDDTQMSLFTAAGILLGQTRGFIRGIAGRIDTYCANSYIDWLHTQEWQEPQKNEHRCTWLMDVPELYARRAPGNTCLSALRSLERCDEVHNNSCGCGGVMRTAPLAVFEYIHDYAGRFRTCRSNISIGSCFNRYIVFLLQRCQNTDQRQRLHQNQCQQSGKDPGTVFAEILHISLRINIYSLVPPP